MKKFLSALFVILVFTGCSYAKPVKIGVLAPIGQDEKDIITWSENVAEFEGKPSPFRNINKLVIYDDLISMIMALRAGQIDRFSVMLNTAEYIVERNPDFELIDNKHNAILGCSIAVREDDKAILIEINKAIDGMRKDGTLDKLIRENILELGSNDPVAYEIPKIEGAEILKVAITGDLPPMDCILPDGRPAGFNVAFLSELGRRINKNFELVSMNAASRQTAITSGRVDLVFWSRGVYDEKFRRLPYPLDKMDGVRVSSPYFIESRAAVSMKTK